MKTAHPRTYRHVYWWRILAVIVAIPLALLLWPTSEERSGVITAPVGKYSSALELEAGQCVTWRAVDPKQDRMFVARLDGERIFIPGRISQFSTVEFKALPPDPIDVEVKVHPKFPCDLEER